jgi:hypothetical protein
MYETGTTILDILDFNSDGIGSLQDFPRHSSTDELYWRTVFPHLVDGQDTITDHVGLGVDELREDQTRTITQGDLVGEGQGLEMFRLSRRGGYADLLGSKQSVDGRRFTDVGVSN